MRGWSSTILGILLTLICDLVFMVNAGFRFWLEIASKGWFLKLSIMMPRLILYELVAVLHTFDLVQSAADELMVWSTKYSLLMAISFL